MTSIYRFVSFQSFVDIIQRKELTFSSPSLWDDPFESYVLALMKLPEGIARIREILNRIIKPEDIELNIGILQSFNMTIFGQCWTKVPESDALWRIYSNDEMAIRIETYLEEVHLLQEATAHDVVYIDTINVENELGDMFSDGGRTVHLEKTICTKRSAFQHEKEVRLLSQLDLVNIGRTAPTGSMDPIKLALQVFKANGEITEDEFQTGMKNVSERGAPLKLIKHISINNNPNFIRSVMLHPRSPEWFEETLKEYCKKNELPYVGKSDLYRLMLK